MPGAPAQEFYVTTGSGGSKYLPVQQVDGKNLVKEGNKFYAVVNEQPATQAKGTEAEAQKVIYAEGYKDLHKITVAFFKDPQYGLIATILYVISMVVLGFHLYHGFGSSFQSLGLNNPKYNMFLKNFGKAFSILVPLLFAIIPVYIHFILKA